MKAESVQYDLALAQSAIAPTAPIAAQVQSADDYWMGLAIGAARRGRPSPNPNVGAVLVREGRLLGVGHHDRAGCDHAEVAALKNASCETSGSTLYVTLEPCNHFGRTPPCSQAILAAGIERVVIGTSDPNPRVTGGGALVLREAGLDVELGVLGDEAKRLVAAWSKVQLQRVAHLSVESREGTSARHVRDDFDALLFDVETIHDAVRRPACNANPLWVLFDPQLETADDLPAMAAMTQARWIVVSTSRAVRLRAAFATHPSIDWIFTNEPISAAPRLLAERGIVKVVATLGRESTSLLQRAGAIDDVVCLDD
jgi:diaminohydroxyphosphoribosylaminopyrimidine deaminase/5-amino-6-(5-phosphoribosylamino)uracil reductase